MINAPKKVKGLKMDRTGICVAVAVVLMVFALPGVWQSMQWRAVRFLDVQPSVAVAAPFEVNTTLQQEPELLLVRFSGDTATTQSVVGAVSLDMVQADRESVNEQDDQPVKFSIGRLILSAEAYEKFVAAYQSKDGDVVTPNLWVRLPPVEVDQPGTESYIEFVSPKVINEPRRTEFCFGPSFKSQLPIVSANNSVTLQEVIFQAKGRKTLPSCPLNF